MKEAHVGYSPFARHLRRDGTPNGSCAYPRISKCGCLDRQKSEVGLMKLSACRWHACCHHPCGNLGILPAAEAASKDCTRPRQRQVYTSVLHGPSSWGIGCNSINYIDVSSSRCSAARRRGRSWHTRSRSGKYTQSVILIPAWQLCRESTQLSPMHCRCWDGSRGKTSR